MAKDNFRRPTDLPLPPLLISESDEEFNALREALYKELRPNGIIERMYVEEFVDLAWQIARLKRCKAGVINLAFHQASKNILWELLEAGPDVARDWIFYPKMGKQVEAGLASYKLDSSIIIAEAIKARPLSSHDRRSNRGPAEIRPLREARYRAPRSSDASDHCEEFAGESIKAIRPNKTSPVAG